MTLLIYYLLQLLNYPRPFSQEGYWAISVAKDRIVGTCGIEKLTTIDDVRAVLKDEMNRYNTNTFIPLPERSPACTLRGSEKGE